MVNETTPHKPVRYLSATELAERIGVGQRSLSKYRLPEPDALIGATRGWLVETVDDWNAARPGQGWRAGQGERRYDKR